MPQQDDFATELRGDDERPMNDKSFGLVPSVVVGLILSAVNIWWPRSNDRDTSTATSLAKLETQVTYLNIQVSELTKQPYVRREELRNVEDRVTGLDERVGDVEREVRTRRH